MTTETLEQPLSVYVKEETTTRHDSLDKRIMELAPFTSVERYRLFVRMQARLQWVTSALYQKPELQQFFADLNERGRMAPVLADCEDLGISAAEQATDKAVAMAVTIPDIYQAIGWLYANEGSNMGAGFLIKLAKQNLNMHEEFGARHLAGHPDGRARHWREFKAGMDALSLTDAQRDAVAEGARNAFLFVRAAVEELLAGSTDGDKA